MVYQNSGSLLLVRVVRTTASPEQPAKERGREDAQQRKMADEACNDSVGKWLNTNEWENDGMNVY